MVEVNGSAGIETRLDPCPLCGGVRGRLRLRLPFDRVWGQDSIDRAGEVLSLYECSECGLQWFSPLELGGGQLYAALESDSGYYKATRWEFDVVAPEITPDDRVLDLGCGDGAFLRRVCGVAQHVAGYDFNPDAVQELARVGIDGFHGSLDDVADRVTEPFSVVTAFHVVEHLPDARGFVSAGLRALRPGGTFVISVPNRDRLRLADVEPLDFPPHHASRWSEAQLARLGDETGLTLVNVEYEPTRWRTQLHVLAHRAASVVRRAPATPGAPLLRDQVRNRRRGLAVLASYRRL